MIKLTADQEQEIQKIETANGGWISAPVPFGILVTINGVEHDDIKSVNRSKGVAKQMVKDGDSYLIDRHNIVTRTLTGGIELFYLGEL